MPTPTILLSTFLGTTPCRRAALAGATVFLAAGCGAKAAATPAPAPAPAPVAAAPAWLTCPDPTDGPSIVANAIDEAHRAWAADATTPLPPACVFTAFARVASGMPDSLNEHAIALAGARRDGVGDRELLAAKVILLGRAHRYAEVSRTYDRLATVDSQPPIEAARLAIAAARQRRDTTTLIRLLSRTVPRPEAGPALRTEYNVVRQARQIWEAINESRGLLRQNPRYVAAYPSMVGNFGTLGLADSVAATVRRAIAAGAARAAVSASVETFVSASLRHASLYGGTYGWDAVIAGAGRVDAALSSPSTKFLVAVLIVQSTEPRTVEIASLLGSPPASRSSNSAAESRRAEGCRRTGDVTASLKLAEARLREGGDRYAGGGVAQLRAALDAARNTLATLQARCSG